MDSLVVKHPRREKRPSFRAIPVIDKTNFFKFMREKLMKPPSMRTPIDINILKQCTLFLEFFFHNHELDPNDKLRWHYNGCKHMLYTKMASQKVVFKHKDTSDHFYIILKGTVGIYIPRIRKKIEEELDLVCYITTCIRGEKFEISGKHLHTLL